MRPMCRPQQPRCSRLCYRDSAAPAGASERIMARAEAGARKELNTAPGARKRRLTTLFPGRRLVGCVGTALATIMKHHNHPAQGRGSVGNVDFNVAYDWEKYAHRHLPQRLFRRRGYGCGHCCEPRRPGYHTDFGMSSRARSKSVCLPH